MSQLENCGIIQVKNSVYLNDESRTFSSNFGSLCDKVGSGKSLTVLGLIANQKNLENKPRCLNTYGNMISEFTSFRYNLPLNLLIVPHGIIGQWETYIKTQTELQHQIIKTKKDLEQFEERIKEYLQNENTESFTEDIIMTTNTYYKKLYSILGNININRLLIDEVETIKIPASREIRAEFTWFISSSIKFLQSPNGVVTYEPYGYVNYLGNYVTYDRRVIKKKCLILDF